MSGSFRKEEHGSDNLYRSEGTRGQPLIRSFWIRHPLLFPKIRKRIGFLILLNLFGTFPPDSGTSQLLLFSRRHPHYVTGHSFTPEISTSGALPFFFSHFPSFPEAQKFMNGEIYLLVKFMITKNPSNS